MPTSSRCRRWTSAANEVAARTQARGLGGVVLEHVVSGMPGMLGMLKTSANERKCAHLSVPYSIN